MQKRIIGVELDEGLAEETGRRLSRYSVVTIITEGVLNNVPEEGRIFFYLFNPFGEPMVRQFKGRLLDTFKSRGKVTIIYLNCIYNYLFGQDPAWDVTLRNING